MTEQWRVFIGMWDDGDPDWSHVNDLYGSYDDARAFLADRYVRWRADSCPDCVATAAHDEARLTVLPHGEEFAGNVEGEDYLLVRADRQGIDDLVPSLP